MKKAQKQFADAIDALRGQVSGDVAIGLFKLYLKARNEYAQQACEGLRERIQKEVQFNCNDIYTINTEIILP